jgi:hypothetical protein
VVLEWGFRGLPLGWGVYWARSVPPGVQGGPGKTGGYEKPHPAKVGVGSAGTTYECGNRSRDAWVTFNFWGAGSGVSTYDIRGLAPIASRSGALGRVQGLPEIMPPVVLLVLVLAEFVVPQTKAVEVEHRTATVEIVIPVPLVMQAQPIQAAAELVGQTVITQVAQAERVTV